MSSKREYYESLLEYFAKEPKPKLRCCLTESKQGLKSAAAFIIHSKLGRGSSLGWDHMKEIKASEGWWKRTDGLEHLTPWE